MQKHLGLRLIPLTISLIVHVLSSTAQDIRFNKVLLPEETLSGLVTGFTQDQNGNMWFSSQGNGLAMYDGVNMKAYTHIEYDSNSLSSNYVECLLGDRSGLVWAGSFGKGLDVYDPRTGNFKHFKHDEKDPSTLSDDFTTCLLQDREGFIWVGTMSHGLDRLDPKTGKFTHFRHADSDPNSLSLDQVRAIYEDKKGVIWVGTGSNFLVQSDNPDRKGGLNRYNKSTGTFTRYLHEENNEHSLADNRVRAIFEDSQGTFWVGTAGDGLHTMDRSAGTFERHAYDPAHPDKLSRLQTKKLFDFADDNITFITEDAGHAIWIGTLENGLIRYDQRSKKITDHFSGQKDSTGNFSDNTTWGAYKSRDGVIWMSTFNNLVFRFDPDHRNIRQMDLPLKRQVFSFAEDQGSRYFSTDSGLYRIDKKTNEARLYQHDPQKPGTISDNWLSALYRDRENRIWVGSRGSLGGLNLFDPEKQSFTVYRHDPANTHSLSSDKIFSLFEDKASDLWIGTMQGLDRLDAEKGNFTRYKPFPDDTLEDGRNLVTGIAEDQFQRIWVGTNQEGVFSLDRKTGQFKNYLEHHNIICMIVDSRGRLCLSAYDGTYLYDNASDRFSQVIDPTTGISIYAYAMIEGQDKNTWASGSTGIYRINLEKNEISKFAGSYHVDHTRLTGHTLFRTDDGQLLFGKFGGYYSLFPDSVIGNSTAPEIILTNFLISDRAVNPGKGSELKEELLTAKEIHLGHDQDMFTFNFNIIHFSNPEGTRAILMLENYDKDWRPAGSQRSAYYYNIPPGHYIFRIKAVSGEGVWAEKSIDVYIALPWWRSWWAYVLFGLSLAGITLAIHRILKHRVLVAERERNRLRELAQSKEIEKAYHELRTTQTQLIQSEKMASLGELTAGIAHEIQNPLNFVNNFSGLNQELIDEAEQANAAGDHAEVKTLLHHLKENEAKINHHGQRADAIVKSMLQHSRSSSGQKEPTDLNALADEYLKLAYHGLRAKNKDFNAMIVTDFDASLGKVALISQDIGRVLLNVFNNAFYAVSEKAKMGKEGYAPTVTVTTKKLGDKVEIRVKDNGTGISEKVKEKVFQPFFTTKPTGMGTGLGLSLSYDIVKAHQGTLSVESKEGEFTEFTILLPC